jgi:hypothetical protein
MIVVQLPIDMLFDPVNDKCLRNGPLSQMEF